jgi:hypothetical protein
MTAAKSRVARFPVCGFTITAADTKPTVKSSLPNTTLKGSYMQGCRKGGARIIPALGVGSHGQLFPDRGPFFACRPEGPRLGKAPTVATPQPPFGAGDTTDKVQVVTPSGTLTSNVNFRVE